jgi:NADPH2:quinone reductase
VNDLTAQMEAGALQHTIAARYPLEEIARAHEAIEAGDKVGTVVLDLSEGARRQAVATA